MNPVEAAERVRRFALSLPEVYESEQWGGRAFKVGANRLVGWAWTDGEAAHVTLKVTPDERELALLLPYARVAAYVGRYGWITARVTDEESLESACEWLRESYWLRAPEALRKLVESDDG